jgi:hypothetical protein
MSNLRTRRWAQATLLVAALAGGGAALAQVAPKVLTDAAPLPAEDRSSTGAVVLMDQPVLAQREAMEQNMANARLQTSAMGAGPAAVIQRMLTPQELETLKLQQPADTRKRDERKK